MAGGAAAVGAIYFLLAFLLHSGTVRTIHRREDLLHPPGPVPGPEEGQNGITPP
jgi:hypothetical protein